MTRKTLVLLYGGRSTEHDIARKSAAFVYRNLDRGAFDLHLVGIDKRGNWHPQSTTTWELEPESLPIVPAVQGKSLTAGAHLPTNPREALASLCGLTAAQLDHCVFFPMIHGNSGEDGTLQGFFELAGVAFVGPDTLGSAVGMDKVVAKRLAHSAGIPVVPYIEVTEESWQVEADATCKRALDLLGLPIFVKPSRLGSSVGVVKVKEAASLKGAIASALEYDDKVLVEQGLDVREVECAMLGPVTPKPSVIGEVVLEADFYSFEEKYAQASRASTKVPADLPDDLAAEIKTLSVRLFQTLGLYGMARVDWFLDRKSGQLYFNEVNTIPGFTERSHYPLFWRHTGKDSKQLLEDLIELALHRSRVKFALKREFT
ncbi:MAG: D-alanine--D-alanine ligase [Pseudomonadota bacterium]|jgi:D-alanine-D-alanine ligase